MLAEQRTKRKESKASRARSSRAGWCALRAGALVLCAGGGALAWQSLAAVPPAALATSPEGRPMRWVQPEIVLQPSPASSAAFEEMLSAALRAGARAWNGALDGCRAPKIRIAAPSAKPRPGRRDGYSTVLLRNAKWCPDSARDSDECYDEESAAFTSLYPNEEPGELHAALREADVEIDGAHHEWSLEGTEAGTSSLRAVVAHEIGHVLGLDHSCEVSPARASLRKKPICAPDAEQSIMYPLPVAPEREPVVEPGRAERAALCALYRGDLRPRATGEHEVAAR